jgi:hypothetical protein
MAAFEVPPEARASPKWAGLHPFENGGPVEHPLEGPASLASDIPIAGILGSLLGISLITEFWNQRFSGQKLWHCTCPYKETKECDYVAENH